MPAYDFKCKACNAIVEVTRAADDESAVPCPGCGKETRRVFSPVGVHFKGSGFHSTDYANNRAPAGEAPSCGEAGSSPACSSCPAAE